MIRVKEARQPCTRRDGVRVLVERGWPHPLKKSEAAITLWLRALAPSAELRRWARGGKPGLPGKPLSMTATASCNGLRPSAVQRQDSRTAKPAASGASVRLRLFRKKYFQELARPEASAALQQLHRLASSAGNLTLVYSAPAARRAANGGIARLAAAKNSRPEKTKTAQSAARQAAPAKFTELGNHAAVLKQLLEGLPKPPLSSGPEKVSSGKKSRAAAARR